MHQYIIFQNIIAPYKILLFDFLERALGGNLLVVYLAETAGNREWKVPKDEITFPYEILSPGKEEDAGAFGTAAGAWRLLVRHDPQVVVVGGYDHLAYWAAMLWAKTRKRKVIIIIESHSLDKPRNRAVEAVKRSFVSRFDAALVAGTRHLDYAVGLGLVPEKVFLQNGVGPVDADSLWAGAARYRSGRGKYRRELGLPPNNFIFVGRFSPEKNILLLLEAYRTIRSERGSDWGLILLGNGPQKKDIERFIIEHSLEGVCLPGFKQKEEVPFYYALSDVLVLPSISEPWGLVVNEAMASGLALLVSNRCGCYPDLLREGVNGYSFDPMNCEELAARMLDITSGCLRLETASMVSREIVRACAPEIVAEKYIRSFHYVLSA